MFISQYCMECMFSSIDSSHLSTRRYCNTGEGKFYFYSHQSRQIHNRVHFAITKMNANKEHRRPSAVSGHDISIVMI